MSDLFGGDPDHLDGAVGAGAGPRPPLAVRMRPRTLDELLGQDHLLAPGSPLRRLVEGGDGVAGPTSVVLWGPPGTGKTTLAHVLSRGTGRRFVELSAVTAGVRDVRRVMDDSRDRRDLHGVRTILFLDEIHRFTKAQQDALLPGVENRWVVLVAATTENPSFSVVAPLLSRSLMVTLRALTEADLARLLDRAVDDPRGLAGEVRLDPAARDHLVRLSGGDARRALTALEAAAGVALDSAVAATSLEHGDALEPGDAPPEIAPAEEPGGLSGEPAEGSGEPGGPSGAPAEGSGESGEGTAVRGSGPVMIDLSAAERAMDRAVVRYDREGDQHYDIASAFIKSMRGSDVDAALHYLARMLQAGEDPRFVARRIMIASSEDVGMADPTALATAVAAAQAVQLVGMPEARIILSQAVIHVSLAPKSNAAVVAVDAALGDVRSGLGGAVPSPLRDAHYPGAARLGHGRGYRYAHDDPRGVVAQQYAPDDLVDRQYYRPSGHGLERELAVRWARLRAALGRGRPG